MQNALVLNTYREPARTQTVYAFVKRSFDIICSLLLIVLLMPVLLVVAVMVAVPAPVAVTTPPCTLATSALLELQLTSPRAA